jgi:hypothetical protein
MNYEEYVALSSEISELEALLAEIPAENLIERMGLEARLETARKRIAEVPEHRLAHKARLLFRGKPVFGSHGIAADFAARAAGAFTDAVAAVAAALSENLHHMGPIPDKQKNQLLITGTAVGSFGFEFELPPTQDKQQPLFPEQTAAEKALEKVQALLFQSVEGSDDEIAELIDEIHPRAVKKVAEFLNCISQQDAWCGLDFKEKTFRFQGIEQLRLSADRLREENIKEGEESFSGEFQGVLPAIRNFEFKCSDQDAVIRGKVGPEIADADILNREYLHKQVTAKFQVIQVGHGRPRYTLQKLESIEISR